MKFNIVKTAIVATAALSIFGAVQSQADKAPGTTEFTTAYYNLTNYMLDEDAAISKATHLNRTPAKYQLDLIRKVHAAYLTPDEMAKAELAANGVADDYQQAWLAEHSK